MSIKRPLSSANRDVSFDQAIIQNIKAWVMHIRWLPLILGFFCITAVLYACSFLINNEIEWRILLFLNSISSVPVFDGLMILITDFSIFGFGLAFFSWEIAYQASRRTPEAKRTAEKALKIIGTFFSIITFSACSWAGYTHSAIFIPLGLSIFSAYWFIGNAMTRYDDQKLQQIDRLFWMTLWATLLTELAAECFIKDWVERPRPLSHVHGAYHDGVRIVADEVVQGGHSYVSGHASAFFAMITPMMYFVSKKQIKMGLLIWATVHAFSRIYLTAHFPYDSMMGGLLGFCMATLVKNTHGPEWLKISVEKRFP